MATDLKKLLYVDDDPDILQIAQMTLESFGNFEVLTCTSGKLAVESAQKFQPDLILMDVMMPEIDGVSTLKILRENAIDTPIIFVTAKVQQSEINDYIAAGGIGVIKKPFDPMTICNEIQTICENAKTPFTPAENKLEQLTLLYISHVKEYQKSLNNALQVIAHGKLDVAVKQELQQIAHKLSGSGATYGFKALSQAARNLEMALTEDQQATIPALLEILLEACTHTIHDERKPSEEKTSTPQQIPRVLLVDDNAQTAQQLRDIFSGNIQLLTSTNKDEILSLTQTKAIELLVLCNQVQNIDALSLLEKLHNTPACADLQILMLIPATEITLVMPYIMAGAIDYLTLPLQLEMVNEKIVERLKRVHTTVLVVDDDPTIRELLAHKFRSVGCQVLLAEDGEEALKVVHAQLPDLIILDYMMPGLDGGVVLQTIRKQFPSSNVPVLFLTAKRQQENILEGFKLGASDYITKPFIPDEVVARGFQLLKAKEKKNNA